MADFKQAVKWLKEGKKVKRESWGKWSKDSFVFSLDGYKVYFYAAYMINDKWSFSIFDYEDSDWEIADICKKDYLDNIISFFDDKIEEEIRYLEKNSVYIDSKLKKLNYNIKDIKADKRVYNELCNQLYKNPDDLSKLSNDKYNLFQATLEMIEYLHSCKYKEILKTLEDEN